MKGTPFKLKQNLSPSAAKKKAERDLRYANKRSALRADSQKKRRAAKKRGMDLTGLDYDHHTGSFVSSSKNRGGMGKTGGTKNE
jgi:hypothetical protein